MKSLENITHLAVPTYNRVSPWFSWRDDNIDVIHADRKVHDILKKYNVVLRKNIVTTVDFVPRDNKCLSEPVNVNYYFDVSYHVRKKFLTEFKLIT